MVGSVVTNKTTFFTQCVYLLVSHRLSEEIKQRDRGSTSKDDIQTGTELSVGLWYMYMYIFCIILF